MYSSLREIPPLELVLRIYADVVLFYGTVGGLAMKRDPAIDSVFGGGRGTNGL
jgi:hypothetical protein